MASSLRCGSRSAGSAGSLAKRDQSPARIGSLVRLRPPLHTHARSTISIPPDIEPGRRLQVLLHRSQRTSDAAALWKHCAADCGAAGASGVAEVAVANKLVRKEARNGEVSERSARRAGMPSLGVRGKGREGCFGVRRERSAPKARLDPPFGWWFGIYCQLPGNPKWKSRFI